MWVIVPFVRGSIGFTAVVLVAYGTFAFGRGLLQMVRQCQRWVAGREERVQLKLGNDCEHQHSCAASGVGRCTLAEYRMVSPL